MSEDVDDRDDLLPGWAWAELGDVLPLEYGKALPERARDVSGAIPVFGSAGVVGSHSKALVSQPCIVIGRKGSAGSVHVSAGPCWPIDTAYFARVGPHLDFRFAYYLLLSQRLDHLDQSTAIPSLSRDNYGRIAVRIPPLSEQRRIAVRIEELFDEIEAGEQQLEKAREGLAAYRRAVLKAVVTGELTREWREKNAPNETGADFLVRILAKHSSIVGTKQEKFSIKGRKPAANDSEISRANRTSPEVAALSRLPQGWVWASLGQLCELVGGITVDAKRTGDDLIEVPYLRVANVQRGFLDLREIKTIRTSPERLARLKLEANDVLINEGGDKDKVGRGWIWSGEIPDCIHQNHVFRARPYLREVDGRFLSTYANEIGRRFFFDGAKQTTNLASIGLKKVSALPVPLPPASEIARIVQVITMVDEEILTRSSAIDSWEKDIARLRQSVLSAAFSGRLGAQVPDDEPASLLLGRLRAMKTSCAPRVRGRSSASRISRRGDISALKSPAAK